MGYIQSLSLQAFRSYSDHALTDLSPDAVILTGSNGIGKTNLLEAVSLLSPGRGLRGAAISDFQKHGDQRPWAISAKIHNPVHKDTIQLGTGFDSLTGRRQVRLNGEPLKSQTALSDWTASIWLTPQMDRLFLDASSTRRRFLDRMVFAFDPGHAGRVNRYEHAMRERAKILKTNPGSYDKKWITGIESQMAETAIAISAARLSFLRRLDRACSDLSRDYTGLFPYPDMMIDGFVENLLQNKTALDAEDIFRKTLLETRPLDAQKGGSSEGPHRSDLVVTYADKSMPAAQCSTGEQKALLTGIVLSHARLIRAERGIAPFLLLDEIAAHYDPERRKTLFDLALSIGGQVWMTGTETALFEAIKDRGSHIKLAV